MKKINLMKSILTITAAALAATTCCTALFLYGQSPYQTVNYSLTSEYTPKNSFSFTPFTHNYHSLSNINQQYYYPDITKENINLISVYRSEISNNYDYTLDRYRNLYYDDNTNVCIYNLDNNPCSTPMNTYSVNTNWEAANCFAYIAADDSDVNANTFYQVFAGDRNLALYFDNGGDIYEDKCTYETINDFVLNNIDTTTKQLDLDFSTLLSNDLDRDNAVLSLLNPMLWDAILTALNNCGTSETKASIGTIDLSYNSLRIVPNIASIPNKNCDGWLFEDTTTYPNVLLQMNGAAAVDSRNSTNTNTDGCITGINLSHNHLCYINTYSYRAFDKSYNWVPTSDSTTFASRNELFTTYTDYPSLLTLVKCRYENYDDASPIGSKWKNTIDDNIGVDLDYNYLSYINFLLIENSSPSILDRHNWQSMVESWKEPILAELLPNYIYFSYQRSYMTYTTYNYIDSDSFINTIEYILGLGVYQTDGFCTTSNELAHYLKYGLTFPEENLAFNYPSLSYGFSEDLSRYDEIVDYSLLPSYFSNHATQYKYAFSNILKDFIALSGCQTDQLGTSVIPSDLYNSPTDVHTGTSYSNNVAGKIQIVGFGAISHDEYIPSSLNISENASINQIATAIFGLFNETWNITYDITGFTKSYTEYTILGICYGLVGVVIVILFVTSLVKKSKARLEYKKKNN